METRKLQKVGGSTYSVSLPKEWATDHHLEAGMPIHLYPHADGSLVVRSVEQDGGPLASTEVRLPRVDDDAIRCSLAAAYAVGYDAVTLVAPDGASFDGDDYRLVRRLTESTLGLSVVEEDADRITVESLLDASELSIRQSVTQLRFTALSMHRTAVDAFPDGDAADLDRRDDGADRLLGVVTRHLNRSLVDFGEVDRLDVPRTSLFDHYLTARELERVADHAVRIGSLAARVDDPPPADVLDEVDALADASRAVVETATKAILDGSRDDAHEALIRRDRVLDDLDAFDTALLERSPPAGYVLSRVVSTLARTAECGGTVATVALRSSARPDD
ncbi:PhoU domain-containing protein [Haloplanus salilacus]|uniref:PhoU domain-containing protein n=1 Tax=Haloplanus salilacus TaxID=2949994 RepID=UPI0030CF2C59